MKLKYILLVAITVIATQGSYAQYAADALRFSQFKSSTTARFDALGGYKSAIGGDLSSLYGNPAGLGMFSKSELSLTPSLNLRNNDVSFTGINSKGNSSNLDLNNVGVVFHSRTYKNGDPKKGLLSLNFGIGYQRRNVFKNDFLFNGTTSSNGLGDYFAQQATDEGAAQQNLSRAVNGAAYDSFLIDATDADPTNYYPLTSTNSDQSQSVDRTGGSSNVDFSLGLNISNNFFIGAGVGLASFRYTSTERNNETGLYKDPSSGNHFDYNVDYIRNFDTDGSGFNLKLGMILKPTNELRLALAFESPTWYNVTDNYSEELKNNIDAINGSDSYPFEYRLHTPSKINGGLAYFFGDRGFLSADVGFVDYSNMKFNSSNDLNAETDTRSDIRQNYQNVINYSIGGEYRLNDSFLLRAGYAATGNPYKNLNNADFKIDSYSAGFGYRFGVYYLDMALVNSKNKLYYSSYGLNDGSEPIATVDTRRNNISLTFGVRF